MVKAVGIAWYRRDDWDQLRDLLVDADQLADTYDEWLADAEEVVEQLTAQGHVIEKVYIDPRGFAQWCSAHGLDADAKARSRFASEAVASKYRDRS